MSGNGNIVNGQLIYDIWITKINDNKKKVKGSLYSQWCEHPFAIIYIKKEGNIICDKNYCYRIFDNRLLKPTLTKEETDIITKFQNKFVFEKKTTQLIKYINKDFIFKSNY